MCSTGKDHDQDMLAPEYLPIHHGLPGHSKFIPGYFMFWSYVEDMHAVGWVEGPWVLVIPLKAITLGVRV